LLGGIRGGEKLQRRILLVLSGVLVLLFVVLHSSFQCRVTREQITVSPIRAFVVPVAEGCVLGVAFNVTNVSSCELTAESILLALHEVTFSGGSHIVLGSSESQSLAQTIAPRKSACFSYVFDFIFEKRPVGLVLNIWIAFAGSGRILIFEGELSVRIQGST